MMGKHKNRGNLVPKNIVDKNGVHTTVYVNPHKDDVESENKNILSMHNSFVSAHHSEDEDDLRDILMDAPEIEIDENYKNLSNNDVWNTANKHNHNALRLKVQAGKVKDHLEALEMATEIVTSPDYYEVSSSYAAAALDYDEKRKAVKQYEKSIADAVHNADESFLETYDEKEYFSVVQEAQKAYDRSKLLENARNDYQKIIEKLQEKASQSEGLVEEKESLSSNLDRINGVVNQAAKQGSAEWAAGHGGTQRNSQPFPPAVTETPALRGQKMMHIRELAAMTGRTEEQVSQDYLVRLNSMNPQGVEDALKSMYRDAVIKGEDNWVYTDIETSGMGPLNGRIIEQAIAHKGECKNYRFNVDNYHKAGSGTGLSNIHGIHPDDVAGKKTFAHSEQARRIGNILTSGSKKDPIILAAHHGGSFEDDWFNKNVPGYIKAKIERRLIMVDTKTIAKHSMNIKNNSLKGYIEAAGGDYENAHTADADTLMMYQATKDWAEKTRNRGL